MPEIPDIELYISCLQSLVAGKRVRCTSARNPFVVRTVEPPLNSLDGKLFTGAHRLAKKIVLEFEQELFCVIHLMVAGRLRWTQRKLGGKIVHASFEFDEGVLTLTEASTKKRASMSVLQGRTPLKALDPGGCDPMNCTLDVLRKALTIENRTLKRALTNQHRIAGIGNAYSDEILFAAKLSPLKLTQSLSDDELNRLCDAIPCILREWTEKLQIESGDKFPGAGDVTAFRPDFAVHGRYGLACRRCNTPIQRIRYEDNETNYCPVCQNQGKILADRALSRLLKDDWPRHVMDLE